MPDYLASEIGKSCDYLLRYRLTSLFYFFTFYFMHLLYLFYKIARVTVTLSNNIVNNS